MSQGYRISLYDEIAEIEQLMDEVRQAHESESRVPAADDRVERSGSIDLHDTPADRVDVHRQMTANLERGPFNPERIGTNRQVPGKRVVKAEPRSADEHCLPARAQGPGWVATEQALERAIDYNEEVLVPAARHPVTSGAVASAPSAPADSAAVEGPVTAAPCDPDKTHGDFAYPEGGQYLAEYAAGAEVVSGDGASYHDTNGTRTAIIQRKRG